MDGMKMTALPCDAVDLQQPALCYQHVVDAVNIVAQHDAVAPLPAVVPVLLVPKALAIRAAAVRPRGLEAEQQPPPDPLFLSTLRLRV